MEHDIRILLLLNFLDPLWKSVLVVPGSFSNAPMPGTGFFLQELLHRISIACQDVNGFGTDARIFFF
jgi:hypothetical protein